MITISLFKRQATPIAKAVPTAPAAVRALLPLDPKVLGEIGGGRKAPSPDLPKGTWR